MVRAMCGAKPMDKKNNDVLKNRLGLREPVKNLATASRVRLYGHVLGTVEDNALRKAPSFKVEGQRKRERPWKTWRRQVEELIRGIELQKEDNLNRAVWVNGVKIIISERR